MKRLFIPLTALLICYCTSCDTHTGSASTDDSSTGKKNIAAADGINDAIASGEVNKLDSLIATDAVDHAGMTGDVKGLDSIKAELKQMHSMMPDMKLEKLHESADGDYVYQWLRWTGTPTTSQMGMTAGKTMIMEAIEVSRFKDGKAVEHWEFMEPKEMMKMMPQSGMGNNMGMDTANNKHPLKK
jgi:predicted ester cyclase